MQRKSKQQRSPSTAAQIVAKAMKDGAKKAAQKARTKLGERIQAVSPARNRKASLQGADN